MNPIITEAAELYKSGLTLMEVVERTNIPYSTLQRKLKDLGIVRSNKETSRKYEVRHDYFSVIDTESKSYWLGFMYADGYITNSSNQKQVGLALGLDDRDHLELFKSHIQASYPIKEYTTNSFGTPVKYVRLLMTSDGLYTDLVEKGVIKNKSLTLTFPTNQKVPPELMNHFIRGYFDGDGSFSKHSSGYIVKICGTKEFLHSLSDVIGFPDRSLTKRKQDTKNSWCLEIGGRLQVLQISRYMYDQATIYLPRKYQRYMELLD